MKAEGIMKFSTDRSLKASALAHAVTLVSRSRLLVTLIASTLALGLAGQMPGGQAAGASPALAKDLRVGHTLKTIAVPGSAPNEQRAVDVHLWYPADPQDVSARPKTIYTSALYGRQARPYIPERWDPLSWSVEAEIAREGAAIDPAGGPFAVIVFSHGAVNDPIDYAHTLELIASAGFVVAAPTHTSNTQDDVRIDYINEQARLLEPDLVLDPEERLFNCNDGLAARRLTAVPIPGGDCSKSSVPFSMADRSRDVSKVLNELPAWFGGRVDVSRAGVMGHSRGTVTALAAAGGSAPWSAALNCAQPAGPDPPCWPGVIRETRVKAIMGMAIGAQAITFAADLAKVEVPALLVRGMKDTNSLPVISKNAFDAIRSADKRLVDISNATHRSFDSTYCAQLQSAGAAFDTDGDGVVEGSATPGAPSEVTNTRPILDRHTVGLIAASAPGLISGKAVHYCASDFFTSPVDITDLVESTPNAEFPPVVRPPSVCVSSSIPCTGLDTDAVKLQMTELAVGFFGAELERDGDGVPDAADNCPGTANGDQADADGDGTGDACDPTPQGTTPPTIVVPGQITANATGPAGATVAYTVSATDDIDPDPTVRCTPSAGSLFAMGDTPVECVATDGGGNSANARFLVTVLGAKEQLARLIGKVIDATSLPAAVKTQLIAKLQSLTADFDPNKPRQRTAACLALKAFTTVVRFVAPPAQAAEWTGDANRIRAVLVC
jgi:predicted dienelactone hydrolase